MRYCRSFFLTARYDEFQFVTFQLYLLVAAVCEAKRISREVDYVHFPNFRTVYHGRGATSYQNVQVDNHDSIQVPTNYIDQAEIQDLGHTHHQAVIVPIEEPHNDVHFDVADSEPYEEFTVADVELKSDVLEHYFNHYDDEHDYDFHLQK
ncbi:PREDICTED: uncharacterized protein LOC106740894 [Dinoponera quadriceps]|uniref:Uncharacterized protein LOC106740894 n=1 Tax=Dinoponera quadriceps TaxID=609295 RepID=A0A6P3WQ00_DINQU|nr:PREDICTED: uncharacterized protein LOC106740894 [Dinoponera quadriceps]